MVRKTTEHSTIFRGSLYRGKEGSLCRGMVGSPSRGISGSLSAYSPLAKGLTQMDLAFACNDKDYSQINRIELGKVNFSVSYLSLIAGVLEVTPQDLLP